MKQYISAPLVTAPLTFNPKVELQTKQIIEIGKNFRFIPIGMILVELSILKYLFFILLSSFISYEHSDLFFLIF